MLDFFIFATTAVIFLLSVLFYIYWVSRPSFNIPGLDPSHSICGNADEIADAGSVHEFLVDLHAKFGPIASFWMGEQRVVSIASPKLFSEHATAFNRPANLYFAYLEPIFAKHSVQTATGAKGRRRFNMYKSVYSHEAMPNYLDIFVKCTSEAIERLSQVADGTNVRLMDQLFSLAFQSITKAILGADVSEENIVKLHRSYDICWSEIDAIMAGDISATDTAHLGRFYEEVTQIQCIFDEAAAARVTSAAKSDANLLIDTILENAANKDILFADTLTFIVAGFHTIFNNVEEKLVKELEEVIGDTDLTVSNISELRYMRQVVDEVLRCSLICTSAARWQKTDTRLGGYRVPAKTSVIQALGVVMMDPEIWPEPQRFDPERFSAENARTRPDLSFVPFGFAGERKCPGFRLAYLEITTILSLILSKYHIKVIEGQSVEPRYGFVTRPSEDIWVTVERRKH